MQKKRYKGVKKFTIEKLIGLKDNNQDMFSIQFVLEDHNRTLYDLGMLANKTQCESMVNAIKSEIE